MLTSELGWEPSALGLLGSAYLVAYTLGQFVAGAVGTAYGPRVLLVVGMVLTAGVNMSLGFTDNYATFGVLLAVNGLAQATGWSGGVGTMAAWFPRRTRGTVMGFWATNFQVGGVLATAMAAFLLERVGLQGAFLYTSWVTLASWALVLLWQRNRPEDVGLSLDAEPADDAEDPGRVVPAADAPWTRALVTNVVLVGAFYFFIKFIRYALWSWTPYLLNTEFGMAIDDAGYLSTAFDAAGIVGVIVAGVLSDRLFRGRRAAISFWFVAAMAGSCLLLVTYGGTSLTTFGISIALIGFFLYGPDALMSGAGAMDMGSPRQAVAAAGIINGMGSCGAVLQDPVLGWVLERYASAGVFALLLVSAMGAAASLSVVLLRNRMGVADL